MYELRFQRPNSFFINVFFIFPFLFHFIFPLRIRKQFRGLTNKNPSRISVFFIKKCKEKKLNVIFKSYSNPTLLSYISR